jgi:hypothetical protein
MFRISIIPKILVLGVSLKDIDVRRG